MRDTIVVASSPRSRPRTATSTTTLAMAATARSALGVPNRPNQDIDPIQPPLPTSATCFGPSAAPEDSGHRKLRSHSLSQQYTTPDRGHAAAAQDVQWRQTARYPIVIETSGTADTNDISDISIATKCG
jgi:hypothetical protein